MENSRVTILPNHQESEESSSEDEMDVDDAVETLEGEDMDLGLYE